MDDVPESGEYYISCDYGTLNNPFRRGCGAADSKNAARIREYYYSRAGRAAAVCKIGRGILYGVGATGRGFAMRNRSLLTPSAAASFIEVIKRHRRFQCASVETFVPLTLEVVT
ncbi:MAG: hypothetical protein ACLU9S_01310 [Oscillospiraceae bacterium]